MKEKAIVEMPPNTAFSERHLEIAKNTPFSRKIATFSVCFV
jgi:hypothetical protein